MRFLCGILTSVATAVVTAIALGTFSSGLHRPLALGSLVLGLIAGFFAWRLTPAEPEPRRPTLAGWLMLAVFALVSLRAFLWLIYSVGDTIHVLSPNNLGDIALHLNLIQYLASGVPFWPESPILAGTSLQYPIGIDLLNSLLLLGGADLYRSLIWVGLAGAALTGYSLWRWGGAFGIAALLFNGGLAGFVVLRSVFGEGPFDLEDYQASLAWKNLFLSMFVTQRGLLFALPAGLLLLESWRSALFGNGRCVPPRWVQALLYGTMPLFSVHTFLFLSVVLAAGFLLASRSGRRTGALVVALLAAVPATASVMLVTGFFHAAGGIHWLPGWLQSEAEGLPITFQLFNQKVDLPSWSHSFLFWIWNFGITLPLWVAAIVCVTRRPDAEGRCFVWASSLMFLACCFVAFATWPWDNMKILLWSWLAVAPYLWARVIAPLPPAPRVVLCFTLFFSGAVSLLGGLGKDHGYALASRLELATTAAAIREIPPSTRFTCAPEYDHPLILLGRSVAAGYEGHLWSHGLDYKPAFTSLEKILNGAPGWQNDAEKLGVRTLYWGRPEKEAFPNSTRPWAQNSTLVGEGPSFVIYGW